ncbi:hypothetical protein SAMN02745174_01853 [Cetobacterium ceti]|uniref:Ion channel n=1 Tax=Cetobacterium ceti TaxID=180163 RepID=A0A1T4PCG0_9FUSO|nr:two pore domain potassium channel family protein [Cetobacterium ceti]SJZ89240.1 hypothetical protein SAMN02745174_01853 [Cetobacterium ceti]
MKNILKIFNFIKNFIYSKIKNYNNLKKKEIRSISLFLSLFLTALEFYKFNIVWNSQEFILSTCAMVFSVFIMMYPCLYFFRFKFKRFLSNHIFFSMGLMIYFTILIPILGEINDKFLAVSLNEIIIKLLHIITIFVSMFLILLIISRQFIMLIYKKRKIAGVDILTTFLTYLILGISFGSFFYIANLMAKENLFVGVMKPTTFNFENYLNYIYISLGNLTTVGTGTISAINPYVRIISVCETILGIFLTSFSLGFIFSVLGGNQNSEAASISEEENPSIFDENVMITFYKYVRENVTQIKADLNNLENTEY